RSSLRVQNSKPNQWSFFKSVIIFIERHRLEDADVCLVGVSRTSKTPTRLYLANRGIKAAVPGVPLPSELLKTKKPRCRTDERSRAAHSSAPQPAQYARSSRKHRLHRSRGGSHRGAGSKAGFAERHWPVIDVMRRSIELDRGGDVSLFHHR